MLDRLARLIVRFKPVMAITVKIVVGTVFLATIFFICDLYIFPRVLSSEMVKKGGFFPESMGRTTIVERRETVTITQDENFERLATEHGSVVVRILPQVSSIDMGTTEGFLGTLVTNDGFIVTYTTVSPKKDVSYSVWLNDGIKETATFEGYDTLTNLAYYRVARKNTPAVAFANTDDIQSGRRLVLLGLSQDMQSSVFPSNIERRDQYFNLSSQTVASSEKWEGVFTLAAMPGRFYLGGPGLLGNGEMAGIIGNRIIDSQEKFFLIPAKVVRESLDRITSGSLDRPMSGVYYVSLNEERSNMFGLTEKQGALVYSTSGRTGLSVIAGSPAAKAGLLYGDIIMAVNGKSITSQWPLSVALGEFASGDRVQLTILRGGKERKLELAL